MAFISTTRALELRCRGRIQTGGHRGTCPLQTHGQQKWSGQSEHDRIEILGGQIFTAHQNKTNSIKNIMLNKRPIGLLLAILPPRLLLFQAQKGPEKPQLYFLKILGFVRFAGQIPKCT